MCILLIRTRMDDRRINFFFVISCFLGSDDGRKHYTWKIDIHVNVYIYISMYLHT